MLDWLDALPDMRISGVQGVLGVQAQKSGLSARTPPGVQRCASTPVHTPEHRCTPARVQPKPAEIRHSTPCTPCTPAESMEAIETGLIELRRRQPPKLTMPTQWWGTAVDAVLLHTGGWTEKALRLGWSVADLYGIGPKDDQQFAGLAAWLDGREVVMIDEHGASAALMSRGSAIEQPLRYRRRDPHNCGPVMIWDFGME